MKNWMTRDMASQQGRLAVITGATGGLGYETALALAGAGARVVLTGRNPSKGAAALDHIRAAHPGADIRYDTLDLASLASIQDFAGRFERKHGALLQNGQRLGGDGKVSWIEIFSGWLPSILAQSADDGALPTLCAVSERLMGAHWAAAPVMPERSFA